MTTEDPNLSRELDKIEASGAVIQTEVVQPTQIRFPGKTAVRTFIQTWLPWLLGALVLIPLVIAEIQKTEGMPSQVYLWLTAIATFCSGLSALLTRVMSIPQVNQWLESIGLGAPSTKVIDASPQDTRTKVLESGDVIVTENRQRAA